MRTRRAGFFRRAMTAGLLAYAIVSVLQGPTLFAQEAAAAVQPSRIGLGTIVIGAGLGIGKLAAAAAEGIARQPAAAAQITGAVNLPLFLLEGVAILGEVFAFLVLVL
jgi:F-type H+-transporting ATPase subunit c